MRRDGKKKHQRWADHYSEQAKKERYPARSVYKLKEAQQKFRLIKKGDRVLDLGSAPGSWLLYAAELAGQHGKVLGIDLKPVTIKIPSHVETLVADILTIDRAWIKKRDLTNRFDLVLSDMAPATTGHKLIDAERSYQLSLAALNIARMVLRPGGSFICKIFQGEEFKKFTDTVRSGFKTHKIFKPRSSRKESKEIFILGFCFKKSEL
jgi:23S rRNA (uridine2552-2'-O)-methyltransferase